MTSILNILWSGSLSVGNKEVEATERAYNGRRSAESYARFENIPAKHSENV